MNTNHSMNILILGCGKLGKNLAIALHNKGHQITTVSKSPKNLPKPIIHLCQDIHHLDLTNQPVFNYVFVILSPQERSLLGYQSAYLDTIKPIYLALSPQIDDLQKIIYISSTRVYNNDNGDVVSDHTPIIPFDNSDAFANILVSAELLYRAYFSQKSIIIRPSGLYSSNLRLKNMADELTQVTECHYMNLIHYQDVVDFLVYLIDLPNPKNSYILNKQSYIKAHFLNTIREQNGLAPIAIPDNLPKTGKQLIATHMQASGFKPKQTIV